MNELKDQTAPKKINVTSLVSISILVLSSIALTAWFYDRSQYVHVTDARITATMVSVSSRIPGWVVDFPVVEGAFVEKGDVLVQIDNRDAALKLEEIDARLKTVAAEQARLDSEYSLKQKQVSSQIDAEQSRLNAATSNSTESQVTLQQAKREFVRAKSLLDQNMISEGDYDARKLTLDSAAQTYNRRLAEIEVARAELLLSQAGMSELDVINKRMDILKSESSELSLARDRLNNTLGDHTIKSPITGVVDETFINQGEYVYPGQRMLMVHDPKKIWVKANVKETELRRFGLNAQVKVSVDAYPDEPIVGYVRNIGNAATSQFALLPSPNPSGNFTKVTQRLEVQIELQTSSSRLRPGMMVELAIDAGSDAENDIAEQ
ncbi:MAG: efflux RND transporter periplasmic adaptor subunit [Pseudomonadales bacterium]|nr:efflux RND transporter periplasmic adaptor subunit [Pseudomonadales bacterium]MDG1442072.1 efflux RND transporter periplasmic adaptor subunit [Pseudomonadales bacterium]